MNPDKTRKYRYLGYTYRWHNGYWRGTGEADMTDIRMDELVAEGTATILDEPVNQYQPWVSEGIPEVEYWKRKYLEARMETEQLSLRVDELTAEITEQDYIEPCDVVGCNQGATSGMFWANNRANLYLRLCHEHTRCSMSHTPMPEIRAERLEIESRRDPVTRVVRDKNG